MIEFMPASEIRSAMVEAERICQTQRACVLRWTQENVVENVSAREDIPSRELSLELGLAVDQRLCEFVVVRADLPVPPVLDTVFEIVGRADKWRLRKVDSGDSPNDPVWTFVCVEEYS
jgi:hypothetical protein